MPGNVSYASYEEMLARFGRLELLQVTDLGEAPLADPDADVVKAALADASETVNGYVAGRYALPLSPVPDPVRQRARRRIVLRGDVPSPLDPPTGCHFHPRCPHAMDICRAVDPPVFVLPDGGRVHCHLHTEGPRLAGAPVRDLDARRQREVAQ